MAIERQNMQTAEGRITKGKKQAHLRQESERLFLCTCRTVRSTGWINVFATVAKWYLEKFEKRLSLRIVRKIAKGSEPVLKHLFFGRSWIFASSVPVIFSKLLASEHLILWNKRINFEKILPIHLRENDPRKFYLESRKFHLTCEDFGGNYHHPETLKVHSKMHSLGEILKEIEF